MIENTYFSFTQKYSHCCATSKNETYEVRFTWTFEANMSDFVDQIQRYLRSTDLNFADCISKFMYYALSVRF